MRKALSMALVVPTLCLAVSPALADANQIAYGKHLSSTCVTCHHKAGADKGIPPINGWDPEAFVAVMLSYKTKERENPVMQNIAVNLEDDEIAALAAFFATQKAADD